MQILDMLNQIGGIESIARELGVSEAEAANGAKALAPAILGGLKKRADSHPAGIEGLGGLLGALASADEPPAADSHRCSTSTATATLWTTS